MTKRDGSGVAHILISRGKSPVSALIRHFDNGPPRHWSHGGIVVDGRVVESRWGRGVVVSSMAEFEARASRVAMLRFMLPCKADADAWLAEQMGKGYDYLAILGRVARQDWQDDHRWHCWELIESYLTAGGLQRFRSGPQRITPNAGYDNLYGVF